MKQQGDYSASSTMREVTVRRKVRLTRLELNGGLFRGKIKSKRNTLDS